MRHESRRVARLVVIDESGRVLMMRHRDSMGREFWATPGGGIEPGESPHEAARREAGEELGVWNAPLKELWTHPNEFVFEDRWVKQLETFFRLECDPAALALEITQAHQIEGIEELRWWPIAELARAVLPVYPMDLATRISALR